MGFWRDCIGPTWPRENPTATTPSSLFGDRNFGLMLDGEVMINKRK